MNRNDLFNFRKGVILLHMSHSLTYDPFYYLSRDARKPVFGTGRILKLEYLERKQKENKKNEIQNKNHIKKPQFL